MSNGENEMKSRTGRKIVILILILLCAQTLLKALLEKDEFEIVHFSLDIEIIPDGHGLKGEAKLRICSESNGLKSLHFYLKPSLRVNSVKDENDNALVFSQNKAERIFPNSETSLVRVNLDQELSEGETVEIGMSYCTGTGAPFGYGISSHLINLDFPLIPHEIAHLWWGETVSDNLGEGT